MRHLMAQFGPALKQPWTKLEAPELTDGLIDCLLAVQAAVKATKLKHGIGDDE